MGAKGDPLDAEKYGRCSVGDCGNRFRRSYSAKTSRNQSCVTDAYSSYRPLKYPPGYMLLLAYMLSDAS